MKKTIAFILLSLVVLILIASFNLKRVVTSSQVKIDNCLLRITLTKH